MWSRGMQRTASLKKRSERGAVSIPDVRSGLLCLLRVRHAMAQCASHAYIVRMQNADSSTRSLDRVPLFSGSTALATDAIEVL